MGPTGAGDRGEAPGHGQRGAGAPSPSGARWAHVWMFAAPALAATLLVVVAILRFAYPDEPGIMLFACVPIVAFGMMFGVRGGILAATFTVAVFLVWAALEGEPWPLEYAEHPLVCFGLGWLSGHYARGALGDHDLRRARANARLRDACAHGEVELYYQPIVAASGHALLAFEGLVRWPCNDGVLMPHDFLPDAERDRLTIWTLTVHTLEVAARDAASWPNGQARVFVNLAAPVIDQNELPHAVVDILGRTGLPAGRLAVEVTEGGIISAGAAAATGLARLRDLGLGGVAIDDFGTGYSSLSRLDRLPVDTLKIDRELVAGTARDETRALTHGIVELAHSLGLAVIAEGVENASTREVLEALGCDAIQGYHVATPLPPDAVSAWLREREA